MTACVLAFLIAAMRMRFSYALYSRMLRSYTVLAILSNSLRRETCARFGVFCWEDVMNAALFHSVNVFICLGKRWGNVGLQIRLPRQCRGTV